MDTTSSEMPSTEKTGLVETPKPTDFQRLIVDRAKLAADWLMRTVQAVDGRGSAAFYSRCYHPLRGWSWAYPETTGYIIPTLLDYAKFSARSEFRQVGIQLAEWVVSLQADSGALPAGLVVKGKVLGPSVFNTGQMILGLVAAGDETGDDRFLNSAARAANWLAEAIDGQAGIWTSHAYQQGFSPAYYTRVCWPMLEVWARTQQEQIKSAATAVLDKILTWQRPNGTIENWAFKPGTRAFTHTIAYTLRGFLESGRLLGAEGDRFADAAVRSADVLRRRMELRGRLAGSYDARWKGKHSYVCLTGQLTLIFMKICRRLNDLRLFSAALKALQIVMGRQRIRPLDRNVRGAIAGSAPIFGWYIAMRYPNWAAKFYLNALMHAHSLLQEMLEAGPCASC